MRRTAGILAIMLIVIAAAAVFAGCGSAQKALQGVYFHTAQDGETVTYIFHDGFFTGFSDSGKQAVKSGSYTVSGEAVTCAVSDRADGQTGETLVFTVEYEDGKPVLVDPSGDRYQKKPADDEREAVILTGNDAIEAVKNFPETEPTVAANLGFYEHFPMRYGYCAADKLSDGRWSVVLRGEIDGYPDESRIHHFFYTFYVNATVTAHGDVTINSATVQY
ncbi:MAG: hypothetical protein IJU52_04180 [Clostridia bacterium]|nr:hypothetical protein [Clostridia bacterium]